MAMSPRTRVEVTFHARHGRSPQGIVFAPGRLVLLGEHVDHQGGRVLAVPQARGVYAAYGVRPDRQVTVTAVNAGGTDVFSLDRLVRSGRRWADLARGAAAVLARSRRLPGVDLVVAGDLPARKGLASSAAYVVCVLRALLAAGEARRSPAELARDAAAVEAAWGDVPCGTMDTYTAAAGRPGEVLHVDCAALTHETLRLPAHAVLAEEDSGTERRLSETPYSRRREELDLALRAARAREPALRSLVDVPPEALGDLLARLPDPLGRRARHVVTETARVRQAVEALAAGDAERLGRLVTEGHRSLSQDFECSLPAIDARVEALVREPDVLGARLQGAGWGGTLVVLRRAPG